MKKLVIITIFLLSAFPLFAQETTPIAVVPYENDTDTSVYNSDQSENTTEILFKSLYDFIRILPFSEVPDISGLNTEGSFTEIADSAVVDMVIGGNIRLTGGASNPDVELTLKIWSRGEDAVFEKAYSSSIGLELFDLVDEILADVVETAFGISADFASINFSDLAVGEEKYQLYINNKATDIVDENNNSFEMRILADTDYNIFLERIRDNKIVLTANVNLPKNGITNIKYQGFGFANIHSILYRNPKKEYFFTLDGVDIEANTVISNLDSSKDHNLIVYDNDSIIQYHESFQVHDGLVSDIQPIAEWGGLFHMRTFFLGGSYGGLGADFYLNRRLWLGVNSGFFLQEVTTDYVTDTMENLIILKLSLDAGYYLVGDMEYDFRLGGGLSLGSTLWLPKALTDKLIDPPVFSFLPGIFAQVEWKMIHVRIDAYYDIAATERKFGFSPSVGFKF